jgi:hypothetical protein
VGRSAQGHRARTGRTAGLIRHHGVVPAQASAQWSFDFNRTGRKAAQRKTSMATKSTKSTKADGCKHKSLFVGFMDFVAIMCSMFFVRLDVLYG